jgi:hypothetical protein
MIGGHMAHNGEPKACAPGGSVSCSIDPIEAFKNAINAVSRNSDTPIFHFYRHGVISGDNSNINLMGLIAVLHCVLHQVCNS